MYVSELARLHPRVIPSDIGGTRRGRNSTTRVRGGVWPHAALTSGVVESLDDARARDLLLLLLLLLLLVVLLAGELTAVPSRSGES